MFSFNILNLIGIVIGAILVRRFGNKKEKRSSPEYIGTIITSIIFWGILTFFASCSNSNSKRDKSLDCSFELVSKKLTFDTLIYIPKFAGSNEYAFDSHIILYPNKYWKVVLSINSVKYIGFVNGNDLDKMCTENEFFMGEENTFQYFQAKSVIDKYNQMSMKRSESDSNYQAQYKKLCTML